MLSATGASAQPQPQAQPAKERVVLLPHRAVYDLKLDTSKPSRSVDGARGRIAFDFTGDACEGYALSFRQVTVIEGSETGPRNIDVRTTNFEDGDGKLFRFKTQSAWAGVWMTGLTGWPSGMVPATACRSASPSRIASALAAM
jgi:hypothetical protein